MWQVSGSLLVSPHRNKGDLTIAARTPPEWRSAGVRASRIGSMAASLVGGDWDTQERWQGGPTSPGTGIVAIREAVKQGVDVNEVDEHGRTPLINAAAYTWDPEIVPYLILQGADVHAADAQGRTALHHVTSSNNTAAAAGSMPHGRSNRCYTT